MKVIITIFVVVSLTILFTNDSTFASLQPLGDDQMSFVVMIGIKLSHGETNDIDYTREVVGIGALINSRHVVTTQEYMRWYKQPNMDYFIYYDSHDFDADGIELRIKDIKEAPQNITGSRQLIRHTIVLLVIDGTINLERANIDIQFTKSNTKILMVGIYQGKSVRTMISTETILPNMECKKLLNLDIDNDKYNTFGSHMCLVTTNWQRYDCKSHIGTLAFVKVHNNYRLVGIKSELHQSCSIYPYIVKFQRISSIYQWVKDNSVV